MRRSIELRTELNAIRAGEGLEPLKVTDAMMAISEVQANIEYGLYVDYNQFMHNSGITAKYGVGENMAGITSETTDPFIGWYYDEKAVSEYMGEHGISNAYNAYKQMLDEGYDFRGYSVSSLGHYKNILKDYEITGMGVRYKETATIVEAGEQAVKEAEATETKTKESYEEATKARNEADTKVEKKEKEIDEIKETIEGVDTVLPMGSNELTTTVNGVQYYCITETEEQYQVEAA